ncbi:cation diffusion facilitator family transporter [Thermotalea metallivorans]|uniref:Putative cation efflux system protein n=1 Tax=Thermotalea metallivorans TaxID=520762 RepID=A0A140L9E3_9FIRM|nr:cation diffusion facilitator family transporter [Thermotalea metallivorans]KXG77168.1 putative cation efflux system protein [Thermotalea metallivorans]
MSNNERLNLGKKASWIGIIGNIALTSVKAFIGYIAGSTAMIADALHSGTDIVGTAIVLQGLKISHQPPDEEHHYGHGKAESIVAKIIAILLFATAFGIGISALKTLRSPELKAPSSIAIWPAVISIIFKEWMYRYTVSIGKKIDSRALIADAWHHRTDAFSSVAALIGITGAVLGYPILDPLAGIIVAVMIMKAAISIYWDAVHELMDSAPPKEIIEAIKKLTTEIEGIHDIQDIKARKTGNQIFVDMKICVDKLITVEEGHALAGKAKHAILKHIENIRDVLIHVNPCPIYEKESMQNQGKEDKT